MDQLIISDNKVEERQLNVAQQIQLISSKEIVGSSSQTTADSLTNTDNVFVQKSKQSGGSPTIRGFEANRILLVVDGVRMNNLIYR